MSVPVIAFYNNKGGVGKTTLVYHIAWMCADLGVPVLAADLDPQSNLTSAFLDENELEKLFDINPDKTKGRTIFECIEPLKKGTGDIAEPAIRFITDDLYLLPGDLRLSSFEDDLSNQWPDCLDRNERAFRVISSFWRILQNAAEKSKSVTVLIDLGPNLGALNRAALISTDYVVIPLAADLFSLQGLSNLGPTLIRWRGEWKERIVRNPAPEIELPSGSMKPIGYIILQHAIRGNKPTRAYEKWAQQIPSAYLEALQEAEEPCIFSESTDEDRLALLRHYRSLMPLAQEARKPVFKLKPGDGAIGGHVKYVDDARRDFEKLTTEILKRCRIDMSGSNQL